MESSAEDDSACDPQLRISKMLNGQPSYKNNDNDNEAMVRDMSRGEDEASHTGQSAKSIENKRHAPGRQALREQLVVNMPAVGAEYRLLSKESTDDCKTRVKQWNEEHHQRRDHAKQC